MFPIESAGATALARGSPTTPHNSFSARSGAEKAQALQSGVSTAQAAAPVETARAIVQAHSSQKSRLLSEARRPADSAQPQPQQTRSAQLSLSKPMTAVLLHELRLQQELADVQEEKGQKER